MKKFTIQTVLLIAVIGMAIFLFRENPDISNLPFVPEKSVLRTLQINSVTLKVEVADTQIKRNKGLGGRESLASDEGMLFVFPEADKRAFWMKGLSFPLDFVWIRKDTVVDLLYNVPPPLPGQADANLPIYQSKEDIDQVLELNAGTVQRLNIKVGDRVRVL